MKKRGLLVECSGARHLGKKIAKKARVNYGKTVVERFPDTELKIKLNKNPKGKNVYFVQSFYETETGDINDKFMEVLFSAYTARELGAKKIFLIAPYLAYLREDKRFENWESVSAKITAELFKIFEKVYVVEPHLHRFKRFSEFFPNAEKISLSEEFTKYLKKLKRELILIGPDKESEQWVKPVAEKMDLRYKILEKTRHSSRRVSVKTKEKLEKAKKAVIIDDIISTGNTLIKAGKLVKANKTIFIATHGFFAENALKKLKKQGKVVVSNTIPSKVSIIDCTDKLAEVIK